MATLASLWTLGAVANVTADTRARVETVLAATGVNGLVAFLAVGQGCLSLTPPTPGPFITAVGAVAPALTAAQRTSLTGVLTVVARIGVEMAWCASKKEISSLSASDDQGEEYTANKLAVAQYAVVAEAYQVDLKNDQKASGAWIKKVTRFHTTGVFDVYAVKLEKVRIAGLGETDEVSQHAVAGALSFSIGKQADHNIKTAGQFFLLLTVWGWGHVAAGSISCPATVGEAGSVGEEGVLMDGTRVYVTPGCMVQYNFFLFPMAGRGAVILLALHNEVMRRVVELVTKKIQFCSALVSVLESTTTAALLQRLGFSGAELEGDTLKVPRIEKRAQNSTAQTGRGGAQAERQAREGAGPNAEALERSEAQGRPAAARPDPRAVRAVRTGR